MGRTRLFLAFYTPTFRTRTACQWELLCAFLAAEAHDQAIDRIMVVNPLAEPDHIEPVELRDVRFIAPMRDPADLDRLIDAIAIWLERLTLPIGSVPHGAAAWWQRRRFGSTGFVGRISELWAIHSLLRSGDYPGVVDASRPGSARDLANSFRDRVKWAHDYQTS